MKKGIVFALVAAFVLPGARGHRGGGPERRDPREGSCGDASDWKVKVSPRQRTARGGVRGRPERLGRPLAGQDPARRRPRVPWHPHDARARAVRSPFGIVENDAAGSDAFRARARNLSTDESVRGAPPSSRLAPTTDGARRPIAGLPRRVQSAAPVADTMRVMEAAFFDLDKTIISRSSSLALSRPMYRAGMVTRGQLVRGAYAQLVYALVGADEKKMDRLKEGCSSSRGVGPARGRTPRRGRPDRRDRPVRVPGGPRPDGAAPLRGTGHLHRELLARGGRPSARAALRRGGRARDARASRTGATRASSSSTATATAKAEAIRSLAEARGIELESSYAYSDSSTDLPMLRTVGHPVAVNPDRELRREAETEGWDIPRLPAPGPAPDPDRPDGRRIPRTRVAAGVVAASAAAAIVLWLVVRSRLSGRRTTAA